MSSTFSGAAQAFAETLEQFGPDLPSSFRQRSGQAELGRRAALLAISEGVWERHLGPLLDGKQVAALCRITTRQGVHDLARRRRLLALPGAGGQAAYPSFQFSAGGRPYKVLPTVLEAFADAGISAHAIASWFVTPQAALGRVTPASWMRARRDPKRLAEAARRSAARVGR